MTESNSEKHSESGNSPIVSPPIDRTPIDYANYYLYTVLVWRERAKKRRKSVYLLVPQIQSNEQLRAMAKAQCPEGLYLCLKDVIPARIISKKLKVWDQLTDEQREICEKAKLQHVINRTTEAGLIASGLIPAKMPVNENANTP
jgi:hypothetical protein